MSLSRADLHSAWDRITVEELRASGRRKWHGHDGFGAGIAEMDFPVAPLVGQALARGIEKGTFSYPLPELDGQVAAACASWMKSRYGWNIDPARVHSVNDVLRVLEIVIERVVTPCEKVVVPVPAYPPFLQIPQALGVPVAAVPMLVEGEGRYSLDFERLGEELSAGNALLLLCNPANPTGTVYTADELNRVSELVERSGAFVFVDEIHAPLVYPDAVHIPYASVSPVAASHSITATSAAKGWNFAGLKCAQVILTRDSDNEAWSGVSFATAHSAATLGLQASAEAFGNGGSWLDDAIDYLDRNRSVVRERLGSIPGLKISSMQATYLSWIDFSGLDLGSPAGAFLREVAGIDVSDGDLFGDGYEGFARLNFATPRPVLEAMLDRLAAALGPVPQVSKKEK